MPEHSRPGEQRQLARDTQHGVQKGPNRELNPGPRASQTAPEARIILLDHWAAAGRFHG